MEFEWDLAKAASNLKKHGVSFDEAATIFGDTFSSTFHDPQHSIEEDRYITVGLSDRNRVLVVSHTNRGQRMRIISRIAARRERKAYEEEIH